MLKILILDDNQKKTSNISKLIAGIDGIAEDDIKTAQDIISAKKYLLENKFDVLLLDIQVPNRFDQEVKVDGGLFLLKELKENTKYHIPEHIIGITAFDNIFESAKEIFSDQLLSIVKYEESSDDWSSKLRNNIEYIISSKRSFSSVQRVTYNFDMAIICALDKVEFESIKRLADNWKTILINWDGTTYYSCEFKNASKKIRVVAASAPQMGMPAAAVLSMKLIENFVPKYLVMTGIAAGVSGGGIKLGDILVADPSWDYGSGKLQDINGEMVFLPNPQPIRLDADIYEKFKLLQQNTLVLEEIRNGWPGDKPETALNIHIGPLASGSSVLAHDSIVESIKRHNRKLIGIDMETYGVLYASNYCRKPRPIAFSIKSVCDFANQKKDDSYQKYAAYTSAATLYKFALDYLDYEF